MSFFFNSVCTNLSRRWVFYIVYICYLPPPQKKGVRKTSMTVSWPGLVSSSLSRAQRWVYYMEQEYVGLWVQVKFPFWTLCKECVYMETFCLSGVMRDQCKLGFVSGWRLLLFSRTSAWSESLINTFMVITFMGGEMFVENMSDRYSLELWDVI